MSQNIVTASTIAAIATAQGDGGIAIVRMSGEAAWDIFTACFRPAKKGVMRPNMLRYGHVLSESGEWIDEAMGVYMKAPNTYTREDVVEIHCHGGRVCAERVLQRILALGARVAEPGEFTKRAFLNGRLDLAEAEAVMSLIQASGEAAARAAVRQLDGGVSRFVGEQREALLTLLALIEASDDFPDEVDELDATERVLEGVEAVLGAIRQASDERSARLVREGLSVVLVGRPNVGKSSLMNALLRQERAIVSYIPGTTRDVLTERIRLGGVPLELSDTAGQRETADPIESIGVSRAKQAERSADIVLLVLDVSEPMDDMDREWLNRMDERYVVILNKTDIEDVCITESDIAAFCTAGQQMVTVSATTGMGMNVLFAHVEKISGMRDLSEEQLTVKRHMECAGRASKALERAMDTIGQGQPLDLAAVDIWDALNELSSITGENATEDVIARVFETFCVGK